MDVLCRMRWVWAGIFMLPIVISALFAVLPAEVQGHRDRAYDRHLNCCQYLTAIKPHRHTVILADIGSRLKAEPELALDEPVERPPASAT